MYAPLFLLFSSCALRTHARRFISQLRDGSKVDGRKLEISEISTTTAATGLSEKRG
jgi:hypothetical protein